MTKVIVTCAVTGTKDTFRANPAVPISPAEIARSSLEAAEAGAAIVHLHVRDPETGRPSSNLDLYRETVARIREKNDRVLLNLTTGPGSRLDLSGLAAAGLSSPEERLRHVVELKPEICSLDIGTMSIGDFVRVGTPHQMRTMARIIREAGVKPELDVFDTGNIVMARHLIDAGDIEARPMFQLVLGARWGAPATVEILLQMRSMLPSGSDWAAMAVGSAMFPIGAHSALLGGNMRVGLEDDIYLPDGSLASSNAKLVENAVKLLGTLGLDVADPREARAILWKHSGNGHSAS